MTFDRDADRLIEAWLDEGPRSVSPRLLDRTLADIHATPQRRRRFAPWRFPTMSLPLKTAVAAGLVLALAAGAGGLLPLLPKVANGPAASPSPAASEVPSASASAAPTPAFIAGEVPLTGTLWLLVGRIDPDRDVDTSDPVYVAAVGVPAATLVFGDDGSLTGSTGCHPVDGTYEMEPRQAAHPSRATITVGGIDDYACGEPIDTQDRALLALLPAVGAIGLTTEGFGTLGPGIVDSDLQAPLSDHYRAYPGLTRLVLRDASGEATLIFAPAEA